MFGNGEIPVIIFGILFAMFLEQLARRRPASTLSIETIRMPFNGRRTTSDSQSSLT
jgi:hypothetical protein